LAFTSLNAITVAVMRRIQKYSSPCDRSVDGGEADSGNLLLLPSKRFHAASGATPAVLEICGVRGQKAARDWKGLQLPPLTVLSPSRQRIAQIANGAVALDSETE
jgi:hypothetical protein